MSSRNRSKINSLLTDWPEGTVALQPWLTKRGIDRKLAESYRRSGWVERIGHGAYIRSGAEVDWMGAVHALQSQLGLEIHPGGRTALEIQGYAHFVSMSDRPNVFLFGSPSSRLPAWFRKRDWNADVHFTSANLFESEAGLGLTSRPTKSFSLTLSAPERAMMEVLYLAPRTHSVEEAKLLMEGLATLRPDLVQELLEACRSVKVKRLFLFLAEECRHAWPGKLDLSRVDLGRGKRVIGKGGRYVPKYGLSVPLSDEAPSPAGENR